MKQNCKAVKVGSSNHAAWKKDLEDNHKRLQEMIDGGWNITAAKAKRPRIKARTPREVIVQIFGDKMKMSFTEYVSTGRQLRVITEIY